MGLMDAVVAAGPYPDPNASREVKKRYSEVLSQKLAEAVASGLRSVGFDGVKPAPGGPGERAFQGGLGPKKVDVSYANEQSGLLLAVSIKTITSPPFGKNLKNRFYDLCPEGITLHLRFPYAVVCALFCFPLAASSDNPKGKKKSTFERARHLLATISGRQEYADPGEKFENIALLSFEPISHDGGGASVQLYDSISGQPITEDAYFVNLRSIYNRRNPHAPIGDESLSLDDAE